jgi:phosphoribosylglycinamide formyltransferase-1
MKKKIIALFASHNGTILDSLYVNLKTTPHTISLIITNNNDAKIIQKAKQYNIPVYVVNNSLYENSDIKMLELLEEYRCNLILLAGYMRKISPLLISKYTIINSHPALLPKFGGHGMYGRYVHEAVITEKEKISGVTIHYVNEEYDEGAIILQKSTELSDDETVESLEIKIKELEKLAYFEAINLV